jgi:hypothetical protein
MQSESLILDKRQHGQITIEIVRVSALEVQSAHSSTDGHRSSALILQAIADFEILRRSR